MSYEQKNPFVGDETYDLSSVQHGFFDEVDSVKRTLMQFDDNIERIEGLQRRSLGVSRQDEIEMLQQRLDSVRSENRQLGEDLRDRIKRLESQSFHDHTKSAQSQNLKQQFMGLLRKYQSLEAAYDKRFREVTARQYRIIEPEATEQEVQAAIDDSNGQVFSQALMQSNRRGEARSALTEVQSRHREIQKIEATIAELAQLFHDMEIMVAEQDQQVTDVQQNVYDAQNDVERGVDNQYAAVKKAKAWRRKKWICAIIVIVIIVALALILGIYFGTHH